MRQKFARKKKGGDVTERNIAGPIPVDLVKLGCLAITGLKRGGVGSDNN